MTTIREATHLIQGYPSSDGAGVKLTRVLDPRNARITDPFLLFDEFRSDEAGDYIGGFPAHPHRGFETVTYMMAGRMRHGDNQGNRGDLGPGSVQWMTAARGIVHEEMPQQENGLMWGYQLWVNLPASEKMSAPAYQDIPPENIPDMTLDNGTVVKVISGDYLGLRGPVRPRPSEPIYLDVTLPAQASFEHELPTGHTVLVHGIEGEALVGEGRKPVTAHEMALLGREGSLRITAGNAGARFLVIAGKPFREPIAHYGPFVMNSRDEIDQAMQDYRDGNF